MERETNEYYYKKRNEINLLKKKILNKLERIIDGIIEPIRLREIL